MKKTNYQPPQIYLQRYADILVNFALNSGKGVKKGETVQIAVPDIAKPLAKEIYIATLKAGAHPIMRLTPTGFDKEFFTYANEDQLKYFDKKYFKARAEMLDHAISIIADPDPEELKDIDPKKIMVARSAQYPFREWLFEKERHNKFSWTLALWGTQAKADIVGLSLEEYWQQIINACFLDQDNPIAKWQELVKEQKDIQDKLNALDIESINLKGEDMDLTVKLGKERAWKTGSGANIPSFEHFTSPDWRGTNGWIKFNQPLYYYGNIIKGIELEFKDGLVTKAKATRGEEVLKEMIATKDANKVGEFSLTDNRFSRITHPMAETLFDENIGGPYGNSHIAVGMAYKDCYKGDVSKVSEKKWVEMGYNNSAVHTDIVNTNKKTATATLSNGSKLVIYRDGRFTL